MTEFKLCVKYILALLRPLEENQEQFCLHWREEVIKMFQI